MLAASVGTEKKAGLAHWASRVLEECDRASESFAADPVHDLRVAIRRCRSMADGFLSVDPDPAWKQMKRLAKPLFSSLGDLRDTQVMLEWVAKLAPADDPVAKELSTALLHKEAQLKDAAQQALADFDRKQWTSLTEHLAKRTGTVPIEGLVFQHLALERWTDARELHRRALRNRSGLAWHQLRIGIKRLRYTAENFLPQRHQQWSKDLRDLQDALGEVHDFDVLLTMIQAHTGLALEDRQRWQNRIAEERGKRLELYRRKMVGPGSLWLSWRKDLPHGESLQQAVMEKLRTWASFLDPDVAHSRRLSEFALELYTGLSHCGILANSPEDAQILEAAALLHAVGRSKNKDEAGYHKRSYRLVSKLKPPLGWSEEDMRFVGALVRYHRGALPANNSLFVGLDRKRRSQLMGLIGILRLANAFDDSRQGRISKVEVSCKNGVATVAVQGLQPMSRDAERVARARYLLETVHGWPILIRAAIRARRPGGSVVRRSSKRVATAGHPGR
jgi:CHAD domain-containing protein